MADAQRHRSSAARPSLWNDPKARSIVFQTIAIVGVLLFFYYIFQNTLANMEQRGITTGFGFLNNEAGFGILMSLIPYDESNTYGRTFIVGLLNTVLVSFVGIIFATILGFIMGVARLSRNWLIAKLAAVYVDSLRNIPLLLQMFFWYIVVLQTLPGARQSYNFLDSFYLSNRGLNVPSPVFEAGSIGILIALVAGIIGAFVFHRWAHKQQDVSGKQYPVFLVSLGLIIGLPLIAYFVTGMPISWDVPVLGGFNFQGGITIIPEFMALLWALATYTGTFIAEIVRSGIQAVSHGQSEAAHALGLHNSPTLRLVVIPQALRVIIPPLTSQYLNLVKNSSLATAIGYPDLVGVFMGTSLNQTGQAIEIVAMTMAVYLALSLIISFLMNIYNARKALTER